MDVKEYQTIIEKTAIYPKSVGLMYCALGLTGEAGEVAEKIKKYLRDDIHEYKLDGNHVYKEEYANEYLKENLKKELGDVLWYITALSNEVGLSLEDIMETNYKKLIARRETNTLHGSGDNREEQ